MVTSAQKRMQELETKYAASSLTDAERDEWVRLHDEVTGPAYEKPDMRAAAQRLDPTHPKHSWPNGEGRRLVGRKASTVTTEKVRWLVDCWIPENSLTLLAGREGIGKSTIAVHWAAEASTGRLTGTPMNVAYVVTEDSPEMTVVPRLKGARANLDRIEFLEADLPDPDNPNVRYSDTLSLPGDVELLRRFIEDNRIGLLILDAAKSVMDSKLDGNSDVAIRQLLEPLTRVARDTKCTVIGLAHFGKKETADTGKLIIGSAAWSQVARSVVAVAKDPDADTVKVWNSKGNLASRTRTVEAAVESVTVNIDGGETDAVGVVRWGAECAEDGSDLLAPDNDGGEDRSDAVVWLEDFLKGCRRPRKEVLAEARKASIASEPTIKRAFKKLGGVSTHSDFPRVAYWSLPGDPTDPAGPHTNTGDPTDPTGADLRKGDDPTGGLGRPNDPTVDPTVIQLSDQQKQGKNMADTPCWITGHRDTPPGDPTTPPSLADQFPGLSVAGLISLEGADPNLAESPEALAAKIGCPVDIVIAELNRMEGLGNFD